MKQKISLKHNLHSFTSRKPQQHETSEGWKRFNFCQSFQFVRFRFYTRRKTFKIFVKFLSRFLRVTSMKTFFLSLSFLHSLRRRIKLRNSNDHVTPKLISFIRHISSSFFTHLEQEKKKKHFQSFKEISQVFFFFSTHAIILSLSFIAYNNLHTPLRHSQLHFSS
jgi:hypothetical protein